MNRILQALIFCGLIWFGAIGWTKAADNWYSLGNRTYDKRVEVKISNTLSAPRKDEAVVLRVADIQKCASDFPGSSFVVVDPAGSGSPCGIEAGGNNLPHQLDDLDHDGKADELVILQDMPPSAEKTVFIYYTTNNAWPMPAYPKRTQITDFQHADPNTYLALESETAMYRMTTDAAVDVLGKHTEYRAYSQHLFANVIWDYLRDSPAGRSLLNPDRKTKEPGWGSIFLRRGTEISYWNPIAAAAASQKSSLIVADGGTRSAGGSDPGSTTSAPQKSNRIVVDGNIRSIGEIVLSPWEAFGQKYDVKVRLTMYAGKYGLEEQISITELAGSKPAKDCSLGIGLVTLNKEEMSTDLPKGVVLSHGNRIPQGVKDVWLALLFDANKTTARCGGTDGSDKHKLLFESTAVKMWLYGTWLKGGYFTKREDFEAFLVKDEQPRLFNPLQAKIIGRTEQVQKPPVRKPLASEEIFVSNSSSETNLLPVTFDLDDYGLTAGGGIEVVDVKGARLPVDLVSVGGKQKVFIGMGLGQGKTQKLTIKGSATKAKGGAFEIKIADSDNDQSDEASIKISGAEWLIDPNGKSCFSRDQKKHELCLTALGTNENYKISTLHNGRNVAVIRLASATGETHCDLYIYNDMSVKVVSDRDWRVTTVPMSPARLFVGRKDLKYYSGYRGEDNIWGAIASEEVCKDAVLYYPSEWVCTHDEQQHCGMLFYGSPSTDSIDVRKGKTREIVISKGTGKFHEFYLSPIDETTDCERRVARLCLPMVSVLKTPATFFSAGDVNANGVMDYILIKDSNSNKMPDFEGDKWLFDLDGDDALQSVIEFGRPTGGSLSMKVFCDTVTGCPMLHGSSLYDCYGNRALPDPDREPPYYKQHYYAFLAKIQHLRNKYDGCLSEQELATPAFVYEDWGRDGLFFKGPRFEGGFLASGQIASKECFGVMSGHPCGQDAILNWPYKDHALQCYDFDGDGDNDVFLTRSSTKRAFVWGDMQHGSLGFACFDLSDNNIEPYTLVDAWSGQTRYSFSFWAGLFGNGKRYGFGMTDDAGAIVTGHDWPSDGAWDLNHDGAPEAGLTIFQSPKDDGENLFGFDLDSNTEARKANLKDQLYLQSAERAVGRLWAVNFFMAALETEHIPEPRVTLKDPYGHKLVFGGRFLPDRWDGAKLECKSWPDGEYDYTPTNGWNCCIKKYPCVVSGYFHKGHSFATGGDGLNGWAALSPHSRMEVDSDGTSSFRFYYSPLIAGMHYLGLEYGIQFLHAKAGNDVWKRFCEQYPPESSETDDSATRFPQFWNDYPREYRMYGDMFLYYTDHDADGYVDTYLLDDDADGYYEKRLWYDKAKGTVELMDGDKVARWVEPLVFKEVEAKLKNYDQLCEWKRRSDAETPYLYKYNLGEKGVAALRQEKKDFTLLPGNSVYRVVLHGCRGALKQDPLKDVAGEKGLDALGREFAEDLTKKDPWKDFSEAGLDTLGRVFSEERTSLRFVGGALSKELLDGVDLLIEYNITVAPDEAALKTYEEYLGRGGRMLVLVDVDGDEAAQNVLCGRLGGITIGKSKSPIGKKEVHGSLWPAGSKGNLHGIVRELAASKNPGAVNLLEAGADPVILSVKVGKGEVIVVPADILINRCMSLARKNRRIIPEKPINQALALRLVKYLLKGEK